MSGEMLVRLLAILFLVVAFTPAAQSAEFGSSGEAVAIVKRVQEKFKRDGEKATFASITERAPGFHDHCSRCEFGSKAHWLAGPKQKILYFGIY